MASCDDVVYCSDLACLGGGERDLLFGEMRPKRCLGLSRYWVEVVVKCRYNGFIWVIR